MSWGAPPLNPTEPGQNHQHARNASISIHNRFHKHAFAVATKHYLQVTEDQFRKAVQPETVSTFPDSPNENVSPAKGETCKDFATCSDARQSERVPPVGVEHIVNSHGITAIPETSAAKSGAVEAEIDPDLRRIIDAWPTLSLDHREAILGMLK